MNIGKWWRSLGLVGHVGVLFGTGFILGSAVQAEVEQGRFPGIATSVAITGALLCGVLGWRYAERRRRGASRV